MRFGGALGPRCKARCRRLHPARGVFGSLREGAGQRHNRARPRTTTRARARTRRKPSHRLGLPSVRPRWCSCPIRVGCVGAGLAACLGRHNVLCPTCDGMGVIGFVGTEEPAMSDEPGEMSVEDEALLMAKVKALREWQDGLDDETLERLHLRPKSPPEPVSPLSCEVCHVSGDIETMFRLKKDGPDGEPRWRCWDCMTDRMRKQAFDRKFRRQMRKARGLPPYQPPPRPPFVSE